MARNQENREYISIIKEQIGENAWWAQPQNRLPSCLKEKESVFFTYVHVNKWLRVVRKLIKFWNHSSENQNFNMDYQNYIFITMLEFSSNLNQLKFRKLHLKRAGRIFLKFWILPSWDNQIIPPSQELPIQVVEFMPSSKRK